MLKSSLRLKLSIVVIVSLTYTSVRAQSTFSQVYTIFQTSCTFSSCHDNVNPKGGLSLVGLGINPMSDVHSALVEAVPENSFAAGKGYVLVNPGDPHSSFLFRKINEGLDGHLTLHPSEGGPMPVSGVMIDEEKELIRQWILFGAPDSGTVVDYSLIQDYYANGGIESMPVIPAAPDSSSGFQMHFGPFFVPPGQEQEYFVKFDPGFKDTLESNRIDMLMSGNSHHFILERYRMGEENNIQEGYREDGAHLSTEGVTATQFSDSIFLPQNTAFLLPKDAWLDLNSHYINFSPDSILKAEVYINVHTQPKGTAKQIMHTTGSPGGISFPDILSVPNDGSSYTFESAFFDGSFIPLENDVFIWSMTSHTHQWGTDFDIYERTSTGSRGAQLFDASYLDAIPTSTFIGYDYAEPPIRYFDPFLFTKKEEGFIFEASYVNNGPNNPVSWGLTSEDEMFIMGIFYVLDTAGLSVVGISETESGPGVVAVYPNPASTAVYFETDKQLNGNLTIYNSMGILVDEFSLKGGPREMDVSTLSSGVYFYRIQSEEGIQSGPFTIAH